MSDLERFGFRLIVDVIPEGRNDRPSSYTSVVYLHELPDQEARVAADHDGDNVVASTVTREFVSAIATAAGTVGSVARWVPYGAEARLNRRERNPGATTKFEPRRSQP